ncbi:MAG: class I SAM-dependent methyltransferase [Rhodobacteraceae bacterium]|nr:class I SAM-dependent methyltransferase [Paracoccaceae bacterium]
MLDYTLRQSGRASLDFLSAFGCVTPDLVARQNQALKKAGLADDANLADDLDERAKQVEGVLQDVPEFRAANLIAEWHSEQHARLAAEAFDQIADELKPQFEKFKTGKTTLKLDPNLDVPKYWLYPIHRTTGGWDAREGMGFIHGELIHRYVVGKAPRPPAAGSVAADIYAQRDLMTQQAPRRDYKKILEIGCSSGPYTRSLGRNFPEAEIWACDISAAQLEQAQRNGNATGQAWNLFQADGRHTGQADASFDLVTSYIILHELPKQVIADILKESFRILKPGGDLLFGDVAPYREMSKLNAWRTDYAAKFGGEPYWRESSTMDVVAVMKNIGFVDVKYEGVGPTRYPWVTYGRKPA